MPNPGSHGEIELRSAAFNDHTLIPSRYSYDGGNVSPPLEWRGIPDGTQELVLLCEDPDAPRGTFTHWVVTHIAPNASGAAEAALPEGATRGRNGFGGLGSVELILALMGKSAVVCGYNIAWVKVSRRTLRTTVAVRDRTRTRNSR